ESPGRKGQEEDEPHGPELEQRADVGVLRPAGVERVVAVDEGALLGAEAVAGDRTVRGGVEGAAPRLRAAARAEEAAADRRVPAVLGADLPVERQNGVRVPRDGRRGRAGAMDARPLRERLRDLADEDSADEDRRDG